MEKDRAAGASCATAQIAKIIRVATPRAANRILDPNAIPLYSEQYFMRRCSDDLPGP
jgi:hypothetical protein